MELSPASDGGTASDALRLLAAWFEQVYPRLRDQAGWPPPSGGHEVENDLRRWADEVEGSA